MNKYLKKPGTPGKKKIVNGKPRGDSGQVNYTEAEMKERRRQDAEERMRLTP